MNPYKLLCFWTLHLFRWLRVCVTSFLDCVFYGEGSEGPYLASLHMNRAAASKTSLLFYHSPLSVGACRHELTVKSLWWLPLWLGSGGGFTAGMTFLCLCERGSVALRAHEPRLGVLFFQYIKNKTSKLWKWGRGMRAHSPIHEKCFCLPEPFSKSAKQLC